jgi:TM2 domain-containing membrane protein YozV
MAMIKCPECGRDISSKAVSCPGCGTPISPRSPSQLFKSPGTAAVLSFLIPGLGQIYNGQIGVGIFAGALTIVMYLACLMFLSFDIPNYGGLIFGILGVFMHIFCISDAYKTATKMNESANAAPVVERVVPAVEQHPIDATIQEYESWKQSQGK